MPHTWHFLNNVCVTLFNIGPNSDKCLFVEKIHYTLFSVSHMYAVSVSDDTIEVTYLDPMNLSICDYNISIHCSCVPCCTWTRERHEPHPSDNTAIPEASKGFDQLY